MKNKIIAFLILIISAIFLFKNISKTNLYLDISKGNKALTNKEYEKSRNIYNKILSKVQNPGIESNILKSFYQEKKYDDVVKSKSDENFLKGNSYVYLSKNQDKEQLKKALAEYKKAMKSSDDINIKKNYELTLKYLNEQQNNQQNQDKNQQNDNNEDKNKQNQNNNNNNQKSNDQNNSKNEKNNNQEKDNNNSNQQNSDNKDNKNRNNDKTHSQNNQQNNKDEQKENSNNQNQQNNSNKQENKQNEQNDDRNHDNKNTPQNTNSLPTNENLSNEQIKNNEIKAILQRLEGNEKQSFKNNERVINIGDNNNPNKW
ncbi:hypothetical protein [uncultured Fusobacterium sp.]|uniref:hypothetical protein n=1 Tax=uncultured Fusobacterium sp. TaxID=159267 RepID=UPI002588A76D|nr:hypothetical protein [uncultured Fusobacterium sp.]